MVRPLTPAQAIAAGFERGLLAQGSRFLLAVSGGADSMALLEAFREAAPSHNAPFAVGHVNHGWRGDEAIRDAAFVRRHCERHGVPFLLREGAPPPGRRSREDAARDFRYRALFEMAVEFRAARVVTAHILEDAAETLLLSLMRGRPTSGLAGIRERRADGVVRPLLSVPREKVLSYLKRRAVRYRTDSSNADVSLERNWLRRRVFPLLRRRYGSAVAANLAASTEAFSRDLEWIDEIFTRDVEPGIQVRSGEGRIAAPGLARLPAAARRRVVLRLARAAGGDTFAPTRVELLEIDRRLAAAAPFRFQAGRRVDFELRAGIFRARASKTPGPV